MFTGIIEETGVVCSIVPSSKSIQLAVEAVATPRGLKLGDSVAVNGCCLTVVGMTTKRGRKRMQFDLLRETWIRTNLQFAREGSLVNLERPLRADGRLDGHFVTGHVDGLGRIVKWDQVGQDHRLDIQAPAEVNRYIVFKGSIAVDGISLTVAGLGRDHFDVMVVPYTLQHTNLKAVQAGDRVNLECDIVAKYVEKLLGRIDVKSGISEENLREMGY